MSSTSGMGKAPTGSIVAAPERPSTGQRAMMGIPPGTASSGGGSIMRGLGGPGTGPPGTAYKRTGTASGRPGTGAGGGGMGGVRTGTAVQVDNRPITQQGVGMGMRGATAMGA